MKSVYDFDPMFPHAKFRVGFIGAHSVGKTSQVNKLARLSRILTITEGVRHVVTAMGYKSIADVPDKALMQWMTLEWQINHENTYGRFLTDRTSIDNAAYFVRYMKDQVSSLEYEAYMALARDHACSYTHLIYFPIRWDEVEKDGFRDTDEDERKAVDRTVNDLMSDFRGHAKFVNTGFPSIYTITTIDTPEDPDARLYEILVHLKLYPLIRRLGMEVPK